MKGFLIQYTPYMAADRTRLNHTLFGRIMTVSRHGKKYGYYVSGLLDKILFIRIESGLIFLQDISTLNLEDLRIFGDVDVTECEREIKLEMLHTGRDYWYNIASKKHLVVKDRKQKKKK